MCTVADSVILFDMNDSSGRYLTMLYNDTRDIWRPFAVQLFDEQNALYSGIQFFPYLNWFNHDLLYVLNPTLLVPRLYTPQHIYSVNGFDIADIQFKMAMLAPNYSTWLHMQTEHGLILKSEGGYNSDILYAPYRS